MKRSRFTVYLITSILKAHQAGVSVVDLYRKHGVGEATVYKWKGRLIGRTKGDMTTQLHATSEADGGRGPLRHDRSPRQ